MAEPAAQGLDRVRIGLVSVSDRASAGVYEDKGIPALRDWLGRQAPQEMNAILGKSLAEAAQDDGKFGFAEASKLALHYQQSGGGDDVLVAFLKSYAARSNLEEALQIADRISDPQRHAAILDHLK